MNIHQRQSWLFRILITAIIGILFFCAWYHVYTVPAPSMEPTIHGLTPVNDNLPPYRSERVLVNTFYPNMTTIHRGDIIVLHVPVNDTEYDIDRIIGLPGEIVHCTNNNIYINNALLNEQYLPLARSNYFRGSAPNTLLQTISSVTLHRGEFFVMGDNRYTAQDSRIWGAIHRRAIIGKVIRVIGRRGKLYQ